MRCDGSGDPTPTVKWYLSDKTELKNTSRISILSNGALHFKETTADDRRKYECVASNSCHDSDPAKTQLVLAGMLQCQELKLIFQLIRHECCKII